MEVLGDANRVEDAVDVGALGWIEEGEGAGEVAGVEKVVWVVETPGRLEEGEEMHCGGCGGGLIVMVEALRCLEQLD